MKVDRDGTGLLQVWRQQITQFHNVTGQVADAIIREYPTPMLLYKVWFLFATGILLVRE